MLGLAHEKLGGEKMKNPRRKLELVLILFILGGVVTAAGVFIQEHQILIVDAAIIAVGYAVLGVLYLTRRSWL